MTCDEYNKCDIHDNVFDKGSYCRLCKEAIENKVHYKIRRLEAQQVKLDKVMDRLRSLGYENSQKDLEDIENEVKDILS